MENWNSVIMLSPSSRSKPVWLSFYTWSRKEDILKIFFCLFFLYTMKASEIQNNTPIYFYCMVFVCKGKKNGKQKKESQEGLKVHDVRVFIFWGTVLLTLDWYILHLHTSKQGTSVHYKFRHFSLLKSSDFWIYRHAICSLPCIMCMWHIHPNIRSCHSLTS